MMDEKSANDWLRDRGKHRDAEAELMLNFDEHARRRFLKSPDDTHSARERLQVQKSNFHSLAVDDEFGGPGNWNAGAQSRHFDHAVISISFEKINVTIMREQTWPLLQVSDCLEDDFAGSVDNNGIAGLHESRKKRATG